MATTEHCLFCFDTLVAHLTQRPAPSLADVEAAYADYVAATAASGPGSKQQLPALRRVAGDTLTPASDPASSSSSATASTTSLGGPSAPSSAPSSYASAAASAAATAPPECPLFVTWNTAEDEPPGEHVLRGCIGTFDPLPLAEGLATYALTAALHDTRFAPVARRELPFLAVAVTLLTDFEPVDAWDDWTLGRHGLRITFRVGGRRYGATYLPDVAPEQGWSKEQTVVSLMRKAGWTGRRDRWRDVPLTVVRYQGAKKSLAWPAYDTWRQWVDSRGTEAEGAKAV